MIIYILIPDSGYFFCKGGPLCICPVKGRLRGRLRSAMKVFYNFNKLRRDDDLRI